MNDQRPGPGTAGSDAATEARVVAWILGEALDFEEDQLTRLVERWPEMRVLKSRLESVNELLLSEALAPQEKAEWRLSTKLRSKLVEALEFFSGVAK